MKVASILGLAAVAAAAAYILMGPATCNHSHSEGFSATKSWGHHTRPYGLRPDFTMK